MEPNQQNKTKKHTKYNRGIEVKNKLTVTEEDDGGWQQGKEDEGVSMNIQKGLMDKDNWQ